MNAQNSEQPMRVTIVTRIFTPEPSAGSLRLQALTDELVRRGHDVRVITTRPPRWIPLEPSSGERISRWPVLRDRDGYVRGYLQYLSFDLPLAFRMLFGRRTDVYVVEPPPTTGAVARVLAWIRRRPYVYYAADIWSDAAHMTGAASWVIGAVRMVEKLALRHAADNLVVSEGVALRIEELVPGAAMTLVGHGVDTDLFSPVGDRVTAPSDVVYVGTMSEWHGAGVAIDALAIVMADDPSVTATFIGQGADRQSLKDTAARHGIADRVQFLPPLPAEEAAQWVRSARVALATLKPGAGYDFAVPTKLYAAMAVGTPVAFSGPEQLQALVTKERLGEAASFDAADYARAISAVLARSDGAPVEHLTDWAVRNVSARSVAGRAADAVSRAVLDGTDRRA
ncbi:glycosyltransferase family 4 protein [Microbacterium phyllosphaerae]|uniref:glycosyltransferase family 4 protein n=1 Tax=Microbacterium phyllosphaerae TaxID=124798 RepID=UPI00216A6FC9|nr:glycosyltransferase family 4 protein [Microbacterium phyllosphaerae]MCS3441760.1 glycosyltransferase involved in cell wall biosynthesis [Microbacterium phyllosphaerae]